MTSYFLRSMKPSGPPLPSEPMGVPWSKVQPDHWTGESESGLNPTRIITFLVGESL